MWTRARIKQEAKNSLRRFGYWMPLLVTFLTGLVSGGMVTGNTSTSSITTEYTSEYGGDLTPAGFAAFMDEFFGEFFGEIGAAFENFFSNPLIAMTTIFVIVLGFIIGLVIAFGWSAFVASPVIVGKNRYFMEHRAFGSKFERLFWAFRSGRYMNVVKIMFWRDIKIFLWSLLFVIPGIIKSYEYSMVPYILAENPRISSERAFELSKQMTRGEKWKIFVLDLSFIGWRILGVLCCCVGEIFLQPYVEATYAELYQVMREKAHGLGFSDYNELSGFFPEQN
ncbi:MAG: DUF975 family protein [Oscillospiraceae bacterium]|nr:DUF975 family protein [Oscillospiraceae bacterium]MBR3963300.1 DUF975 family protein [Oscillospiraceae bacterium]